MNKRTKTFDLVLTALFMAIIIVMTMIPNLGYINLVLIKATLLHVPVIIGSIVLGPRLGAVLGATFGITSLIKNTIEPSLLSFAFTPFYQVGEIGGSFWSIVVSIVPRVLVGVVPYLVYTCLLKLLRKVKIKTVISLALAGIVGSFTNTILVMSLIYVFFREEFAKSQEIAITAVYKVILGIIGTNGVPEAIVACIFTLAVGGALISIAPKLRNNRG